MHGDLLQHKSLPFAELFQQVIIPQPALAKLVVITDYNRMRVEFLQQEFFYILLGRQLRKSLRKRNDHQVIHFFPGQQGYLFFGGIDQTNGGSSAFYDLAGVGMKSNDHRLPQDPGGTRYYMYQV